MLGGRQASRFFLGQRRFPMKHRSFFLVHAALGAGHVGVYRRAHRVGGDSVGYAPHEQVIKVVKKAAASLGVPNPPR